MLAFQVNSFDFFPPIFKSKPPTKNSYLPPDKKNDAGITPSTNKKHYLREIFILPLMCPTLGFRW
jgi:hypothetical protein